MQINMFDIEDCIKAGADFNGDDYQPKRDKKRLTGQILRVFNCMKDGKIRTLSQIAQATGDPEASISAQLRHLRKDRFGGHRVDKVHVENGLYVYTLTPSIVDQS